jgi:hypothetical protein
MTERAKRAADHRFEKRIPAPERPLPKLKRHPIKPFEVWAVADGNTGVPFRWLRTWRVGKFETMTQAIQSRDAQQKGWTGKHYKMEIRYAASKRD